MKNPDKSDDKITDNYGEKWVLKKRDSNRWKLKTKLSSANFAYYWVGLRAMQNREPTLP